MIPIDIDRDTTSVPTYMTKLSDEGWSGRLSGDAELVVAVPAKAVRAIISADDYVWIKADGAITMPTVGAAFLKTNQELARDAIIVTGITNLHFKARNDTDMSVAFYG